MSDAATLLAELLAEARELRSVGERLVRRAEKLERKVAAMQPAGASERPPVKVSDTDRALARRIARKHGLLVRGAKR